MAEQQSRYDELRLMLEEQKRLLSGQSEITRNSAPESTVVLRPDKVIADTRTETASTGSANASRPSLSRPRRRSRSFSIGAAHITPVGFMDLTAFFRSTNTGTGIGTNFGSIPLSTTTAGNLSEFRFSAHGTQGSG